MPVALIQQRTDILEYFSSPLFLATISLTVFTILLLATVIRVAVFGTYASRLQAVMVTAISGIAVLSFYTFIEGGKSNAPLSFYSEPIDVNVLPTLR